MSKPAVIFDDVNIDANIDAGFVVDAENCLLTIDRSTGLVN